MKTWIKLYTEINRDPDIGTLTWAQRGIWMALLALAGEIDDRDEDEQETGMLDTIDRVAWSIRCDVDELGAAVQAFEERGMVWTSESGVLVLVNYSKRQCRPPSARPSAVAERVQRHRAKSKPERNEDVTRVKRGVTPSEAEADTEAESESESDQSRAESDGPSAADAVAVLVAFGMGQARKVLKETQLTPVQVIETTQWAEQEGKTAGLLRTMLRQNEAHQPRAPDNSNDYWRDYVEKQFCPKCSAHPCICEELEP